MNLLAWLIAEHAVAHDDSSFSVTRAGINELFAENFPAVVRLFLVARLQLHADEIEKLHELNGRISLEGGKEIATFSSPIAVNATDPPQPNYFWHMVGQVQLLLPQAGVYIIEGRVDEDLQLPLMYLHARTRSAT